jgi:hypothetical protein
LSLHAAEMLWLQMNISHPTAHSNEYKEDWVLEDLQSFCHTVYWKENKNFSSFKIPKSANCQRMQH